MKTLIKLAVAGVALASGAAYAAPIASTATAAAGSSLVLFAKDYSLGATDQYFFVDLGVQIGSLISLDSLDTSASFFNVSGIQQSSLDAFNAWRGTRDTSQIKWSVLAGERNATGTGLLKQGEAFTNTALIPPTQTSTNINSFVSGLITFEDYLNSQPQTQDGIDGLAGWDGSTVSNGALADTNWAGGAINGALLGTAQTLYYYAMSATAAAPYTYTGARMTLGTDGVLTVVNPAAVPVPAAIWLLGSGLMGLVGLGRRRVA